jgi:hypothetical protein
MLLILVSERLPFCVTHLVLCFFWNQLTALSEGRLYLNSVRTSKRTPRFTINDQLVNAVKEIIPV